MDQFTKFGVYVSIIGAALFVLGFIFVTSLNYTAENQVTKVQGNRQCYRIFIIPGLAS